MTFNQMEIARLRTELEDAREERAWLRAAVEALVADLERQCIEGLSSGIDESEALIERCRALLGEVLP